MQNPAGDDQSEGVCCGMAHSKQQAAREFKRSLKWIAGIGVLTVIGALFYLKAMDAWSVHAVIATVLGVFISMLLGCGLFALAFFSDKSGHDEDVTNATSKRRDS
jgi:hypothetical protein